MLRSNKTRKKPTLYDWIKPHISRPRETQGANANSPLTSNFKPDLRWAEEWDVSSILTDHVELLNTQTSFGVPLVDLPISRNLRLTASLQYSSGESQTNGLAGNGWITSIPQDHIVLDFRGSINPDDYHYYIVTNSQMSRMVPDPDRQSVGSVDYFKLEDEEEDEPDPIQISFDKSTQTWSLENSQLKSVYGRDPSGNIPEALQYTLSWNMWRGPGRNATTLKTDINGWYMVSREEKIGLKKRALQYEYLFERTSLPGSNGKSYTSVVQLKSILDPTSGSRLDFSYATKDRAEYFVQNYKNHQGSLQFPVFLTAKHYLEQVSVETPECRQVLQFKYELVDRKFRLLTGLSQIFHTNPPQHEELIRFKYAKYYSDMHFLSEIHPAMGDSDHVKLSYQQLSIPVLNFGPKTIVSYPATDNIQIADGPDYKAMAFDIGTGSINIRILTTDMSTELAYLSTATGLKEIKSFATMAFPHLVAVLIETETNRKLCIFTRDPETEDWGSSPKVTFPYSKNSTFRFSDRIMAVATSPSEMEIFEPDDVNTITPNGYTKTAFSLRNSDIRRQKVSRMICQGKAVLGYNGLVLFAVAKVGSTWTEKVLLTDSSQEANFIANLDLSSELNFSSYYTDQLNMIGLQATANAVFLPVVKWRDGVVSCHANMLLLDSTFGVRSNSSLLVKSERMTDIRKSMVQSGTTFEFKYVRDSSRNKYVVTLHRFSGDLYDLLNSKCNFMCSMEKLIENFIEEFNDDYRDMYKKMIFFDTSACLKFDLKPGAVTASAVRFPMEGDTWGKESYSSDDGQPDQMQLAKDFIVESVGNFESQETSFRFYRQNKETGGPSEASLTSFKVGANGTVAFAYPSYVAYQEDTNAGYQHFKVMPFHKDSLGEEILMEDEEVLRVSNAEVLLTLRDVEDLYPFKKELLVRRVTSLIPSEPVVVLSSSELRGRDGLRKTSYENYFKSNATTMKQENSLKITLSEGSAGWFEETTLVPIDAPQNATKIQRWFDSKGVEVSSQHYDPMNKMSSSSEEETERESWCKIWDTSEDHVISNIAPYNRTFEMVGYFGFENYENSHLEGTRAKWEFPPGGVVVSGGGGEEGSSSLTGENFLRLRGSERISSKFNPKDQNGNYLISGWVRRGANEVFQFEKPVEYLKAVVETPEGDELIGLYGQMKREVGDWLYVEVAVNLANLRKAVFHEISEVNYLREFGAFRSSADEIKFQIRVEFDSASHPEQLLDVDHVRFFPIHFRDFRVTIFHPESGLTTGVILPNGAILRKIYNQHGQEIVNIDENGNVEQLTSESKSGRIFPSPVNSGRAHDFLSIGTGIRSELILQPEVGVYENFLDSSAFENRWGVEFPSYWRFSRGKVTHVGRGSHFIHAKSQGSMFSPRSSSLRFEFRLTSDYSSVELFLSQSVDDEALIELKMDPSGTSTLSLPSVSAQFSNLPSSGELILFAEEQNVWVWLDGVLLVDQEVGTFPSNSPWSSFSLRATGEVDLTSVIILQSPKILVQYYNSWGDRTQLIQLENANSALVSETLYDELGRDAIKTRTARITRSSAAFPLLHYHTDFVTNKVPSESNSVFKTGILEGIASSQHPEDEGYSYARTVYLKDMLRQPEIEGLPGKQFSVEGPYAKKYSRDSNLPFMRNLFPPRNGFKQRVIYEPNGSVKVHVSDRHNNEVALYIRVAGFNDLLTTFNFNEKNRLTLVLPPVYHEKVNTFNRTSPWPSERSGFTKDELYWQHLLGTSYIYSQEGRLISKSTPDSGTRQFTYDLLGNLRFMYYLNPEDPKVAENVVTILSSGQNQPVQVGYLTASIPISELRTFDNSTSIPSQELYQQIVYSDTHTDPNLRGRVKLFTTYNNVDPVTTPPGVVPPLQETIQFNSERLLTSKSSSSQSVGPYTSFHRHYKRGKLSELVYPKDGTEPGLTLIYAHDKMGRLTALGTRSNPTQFATFEHSETGNLLVETLQPGTEFQFNRTYSYGTAGFLTSISDRYLSEEMTFTEGGYGQDGFGDGIIMKTTFRAGWWSPDDGSRARWFRLPMADFIDDRLMSGCIEACKRLGFINQQYIPLKFLSHADISLLPYTCSGPRGLQLMKLIGAKLPPSPYYGHRFSHGHHQELAKAKFFDEPQRDSPPLQYHTFFHAIPDFVSVKDSELIWDALSSAGFILVDNSRPDDKSAGIGKEGLKPIFRYDDLEAELKSDELISLAVPPFQKPIMDLLYKNAMRGEGMVTGQEFQEKYVEWMGYKDTETATLLINRARDAANKVFAMLQQMGYISAPAVNLLHPEFVSILRSQQHGDHIVSQVAEVLENHFTTQIGRSVFDYQSYKIDGNGNHHKYSMGLHRYESDYNGHTNQIMNLRVRDPFAPPGEDDTYHTIIHDALGNVVKAGNRNIEEIRYHPVTNRPVFMQLGDGRKMVFHYDANGERILKRVFDSDDTLLSQVTYLRDEKGHVLMDTKTSYEGGVQAKEVKTTYLHGPRGLLGFIRNGKFHVVFRDHAGSTRLIIQNGEVVAGYDYWPYGETMRVFGDDPESHISYRFTGQEYDEETGLYNYHARMYDPEMGRFYQPDPKSQYYSPYVYAGNSPISLVDPDGEEAITMLIMMIVFAIIGAYLGAAAANGNWNPLQWDWTSMNTWKGIVMGGVAGAMLPKALLSLPAVLIGLSVAYLQMAQVNGGWNPGAWDWSSPATYNAFFTGMAAGAKTGLKIEKAFKGFTSLSKLGQMAFMAKGIAAGLLGGLKAGVGLTGSWKFWEWDFKDPAVVAGIASGFMTGFHKGTGNFKGELMGFAKFVAQDSASAIFDKFISSSQQFAMDILKSPDHPLFQDLGLSLLAHMKGVEYADKIKMSLEKTDWNSMSSYEGIMNGLILDQGVMDMLYDFRIGNMMEELPNGKCSFAPVLAKQGQMLGGLMEAMRRDLKELAQFYSKAPGDGHQRRSNLGSPQNETSMTSNLLQSLARNTETFVNLVNRHEVHGDQAEVDFGVESLLEGLSMGDKIFPVENLSNYMDCVLVDYEDGDLEECDIGLHGSRGKTASQNRELVHQLFVPSRRKDLLKKSFDFVKVELSPEGAADHRFPEEFLDRFGVILEESSGLSWESPFFYNFFVGAVFHSLLNSGGSGKRVFIRNEVTPNGHSILHLGLYSQSRFSVRSVVIVEVEDDTVKKDVAEVIREQQFLCQIPVELTSQVEALLGEVLLVERNTREMFIMNPELSSETLSCSGSSPYFIEVQSFSEAQLLQTFESYMDSPEKSDTFEAFVQSLISTYNDIEMHGFGIDTFGEVSFLGFVYGLLSFNLKLSHDLHISLVLEDHNKAVSFLAGKKSSGGKDWHGLPSTISFNRGFTSQAHQNIFKLSSSTLAREGLVASLDYKYMLTLLGVETVVMPQFQGIFSIIEESSEEDLLSRLESHLKYVYYTGSGGSTSRDEPHSGNLHFMSNFILGELLAQLSSSSSKFDIFVFAPSDSPQQQRLGKQRVFFLKNQETKDAIFLNVIEASVSYGGVEFSFDATYPIDVPSIPDLEVSSVRQLTIKLNINSRQGWSVEEAGGYDDSVLFQGIDDYSTGNPSLYPYDPTPYIRLTPSTSGVVESSSSSPFKGKLISELFQLIAGERFRQLLSSERDFHSIVFGFLSGMTSEDEGVDGIRLALQKYHQLSAQSPTSSIAAPLSLIALGGDKVVPNSKQVLVSNLKFVESGTLNLDSELEKAERELGSYLCSKKEYLLEALKVTKIPAVYDVQASSDPVRYTVDDKFMSREDESCENDEGFTFQNLHGHNNRSVNKRSIIHPESASSSSAGVKSSGFSSFPLNFLKQGVSSVASGLASISQFIYGTSNNHAQNLHNAENHKIPEFDNKDSFEEQKYTTPKPMPPPSFNHEMDNCQLGAWVDGQYSMDGITCFTDSSKISVHRIINSNDIGVGGGGGDIPPPSLIYGDTFSKASCTPVEFNGLPSVSCEGSKTTFVYTPFPQERMFDNLDGNLMLARLALHFGGKLWGKGEGEEMEMHDGNNDCGFQLPPEMVEGWRVSIGKIENLLVDYITQLGRDPSEIEWAEKLLVDCKLTLEEILANDEKRGSGTASQVKMADLQERLDALHEDLLEQVEIFRETKKGADDEGFANNEQFNSEQHFTHSENTGMGGYNSSNNNPYYQFSFTGGTNGNNNGYHVKTK